MLNLDFLHDYQGIAEQLDFLRRIKANVLLEGPTGVGKTSHIEHCVSRNEMSLLQKMGGRFSVSKLVGYDRLEAVDGVPTTRFVAGCLLRAIQQENSCFYLDEIDAVTDEIYDLLHPLLDHRRGLSKAELGVEVQPGEAEFIPAPEDFWFVGSCVNKHRLPEDFIDRFRVIEVKPLPYDLRAKMLCDRFGISTSVADEIVKVGRITEKLEWQKPASIRQLVNAAADISMGQRVEIAMMQNLVNPNSRSLHELECLRQALKTENLIELPIECPEDREEIDDFRKSLQPTFLDDDE